MRTKIVHEPNYIFVFLVYSAEQLERPTYEFEAFRVQSLIYSGRLMVLGIHSRQVFKVNPLLCINI